MRSLRKLVASLFIVAISICILIIAMMSWTVLSVLLKFGRFFFWLASDGEENGEQSEKH